MTCLVADMGIWFFTGRFLPLYFCRCCCSIVRSLCYSNCSFSVAIPYSCHKMFVQMLISHTHFPPQISMLNKFSEMIRGNLTKIQRQKIVALVTIEVHARDVIEKMIKSGCGDVSAFEWLSQLRLYWDKVLQWHVYLLLFCCLLNSIQSPSGNCKVRLRFERQWQGKVSVIRAASHKEFFTSVCQMEKPYYKPYANVFSLLL